MDSPKGKMISRLKIGERRKKALEADCFGVLVEGVVSRSNKRDPGVAEERGKAKAMIHGAKHPLRDLTLSAGGPAWYWQFQRIFRRSRPHQTVFPFKKNEDPKPGPRTQINALQLPFYVRIRLVLRRRTCCDTARAAALHLIKSEKKGTFWLGGMYTPKPDDHRTISHRQEASDGEFDAPRRESPPV